MTPRRAPKFTLPKGYEHKPLGTPYYPRPKVVCGGCKGRAFHTIAGAPAWICDRCHPAPHWVSLGERYEIPGK